LPVEPDQISTGSPANVSEVPFAFGGIVGQVPLMAGRYWAEGLSPLPPLPELLEELTLASVMSLPLDPEEPVEVWPPLDPEPPLDPDPELELWLPLDPDPELSLPLDPEPEPEVLPELLDGVLPELLLPPPNPPGSVDADPQAAMSTKLVNPTPKASVQRIGPSVAAQNESTRGHRFVIKARA
jgi:hypothetical protein